MHELIKKIAEQASHQSPDGYPITIPYNKDFVNKFAELLKQEIYNQVKEELVSEEEILKESNVENRCYLNGNNGGVIDALTIIKNFGV